METLLEHVIEPDVAAAPPRRTSLPGGTNLLLLAAILLFALFIYGGLRALEEAAKLAWMGVAGRTVSAQVSQVQTDSNPPKGQAPRQTGIQYAYVFPFGDVRARSTGVARLETGPADGSGDPVAGPAPIKARLAAPTFHVGDQFPLRCAVWLGRPLVFPWQAPPTGKMVFLFLCSGLVISISVLLMRRLLRWRTHRLRLLQHGVATVGTILHKQARAEDAVRYFVRYGYAAGAMPREHEEQVSQDQWGRLEVGQPVTVLYDPDATGNAGLYALIRP